MSHEEGYDVIRDALEVVATTLETAGDTSFDARQPVHIPGIFDRVRDRAKDPRTGMTFLSRMVERSDEGTYETLTYTHGNYRLEITTLHEPIRGVVDAIRRIGRRPESKFVLEKQDVLGDVQAKMEVKVYGRSDGCTVSYADRTREHDFSHVSINEHGLVEMPLSQLDSMRVLLDDIDVIM